MAKDYNKYFDTLLKSIEELEPKMSKDEFNTCEILCDNIDKIPSGFFKDKSTKDLNEHFGANDRLKVTELVKDYMILFQEMDEISNAMMAVYAERSTDEDVEDFKSLLTKTDSDEPKEQINLTEDEIIENAEDLEMCPPDMFDSFENFNKYASTVWPNHPAINEQLFKKIQKARIAM